MGRLVEMLRDKDPAVCRSVVEMLKACDASEREVHMGQLVEMLGDKDPDMRLSVVVVLKDCSVGKLVLNLPGVVLHLEHTQPEVRAQVFTMLTRFSLLKQVKQALDDLPNDDGRYTFASKQLGLHQRTMLHILAASSDAESEEWRTAMCDILAPWTSKQLQDSAGNTAFEVGATAQSKQVKQFFDRYGTYLGRYRLAQGIDEHTSGTSVLKFATDLEPSPKVEVALKCIKNEKHFLHELRARSKNSLQGTVVRVLCWHTPQGMQLPDDFSSAVAAGLLPQGSDEHAHTADSDEYKYIIVLERCELSAHAYVSKQRVAGFQAEKAAYLAMNIAKRVSELHAKGLAHLDLKMRNVRGTHADARAHAHMGMQM